MHTIYKTSDSKSVIMALYDEKLQSLRVDYKEIDIQTNFGNTRVIQSGPLDGEKLVFFHGIHAGAPLTLEAVQDLCKDYCLYIIETVGQATKSAETKMNIKNADFALWADEAMDKLGIEKATVVGISYGAFILQKLMIHRPSRIEKAILVVPSGIVNGNFGESMKKLTFPFLLYKLTKREKYLNQFLHSFLPDDDFMHRMLRAIFHEVKLDTRKPTLLKKDQVSHFSSPVYILAAENDIYFPGEKVIQRSKTLFPNLQETYLLKESKHSPSADSFAIIQSKIREWMERN